MRFMMFMYPEIADEDWNPSAEDVAEMSRYNEELRKAGMLLSLDGLRPPSEGVRVKFDSAGGKTITDGPFTEAREVVGGYWLIEARDRDEAVEWASRVPGRDCTVEVRRIFELEEFSEDAQEAVAREWGGEL